MQMFCKPVQSPPISTGELKSTFSSFQLNPMALLKQGNIDMINSRPDLLASSTSGTTGLCQDIDFFLAGPRSPNFQNDWNFPTADVSDLFVIKEGCNDHESFGIAEFGGSSEAISTPPPLHLCAPEMFPLLVPRNIHLGVFRGRPDLLCMDSLIYSPLQT